MSEVVQTAQVAPEAQTPSEAPEVKVEATPVEGEKSEDAPKPEETAEDYKKRLEKAEKKTERQKAANRDAQRHIREMQQKLAEYEARLKPSDGRPREEDFTDFGEFKKAEGRWEAKQELETQKAEASKPTQEQTQANALEHAKKAVAFQAAQDTYSAANPEYVNNSQVVNKFLALANPESPSFKIFGDYVLDVQNKGLEIINYLGANPAKCLELFQMSPDELRDELEEIKGNVDAPKVPKRDLPEPPSSIKGSGRPGKSVDDMSGKELLERFKVGRYSS